MLKYNNCACIYNEACLRKRGILLPVTGENGIKAGKAHENDVHGIHFSLHQYHKPFHIYQLQM